MQSSMKLPLFPQDKANHALYGALIAAVALIAALVGSLPLVSGCWLAAVASGTFAIGKELHDRQTGRGTPDVFDAVATMAGALLTLAPPLSMALMQR